MGIFNWVNLRKKCHYCDHVLTKWQTKDCYPDHDLIDVWEPQRFYENCPECKKWNEYKVQKTLKSMNKEDEHNYELVLTANLVFIDRNIKE